LIISSAQPIARDPNRPYRYRYRYAISSINGHTATGTQSLE
jgi:hypothetical protein